MNGLIRALEELRPSETVQLRNEPGSEGKLLCITYGDLPPLTSVKYTETAKCYYDHLQEDGDPEMISSILAVLKRRVADKIDRASAS